MSKRKLDIIGCGPGDPFRVKIGDQFFLVCCDCNLRHIVTVAKSPRRKDEVVLNFHRDYGGTKGLRARKRR